MQKVLQKIISYYIIYMTQRLVLLVIITLISLCEMIGQGCIKRYHANKNMSYCLYAIIFYAMICYLLLKSYNYEGMGIVNVLWSGISILIILFAGIMFFNEVITTKDKIGVAFIIMGMFFILYK